MNQGLLKRYKEQLEKIKQYLKENDGSLSQKEVDALLERISWLVEMIQIFENS